MNGNNEREIIHKDMKALYLGNLNTIEFDIELPQQGQCGTQISWSSSHEGILTSGGVVRRPSFGMGNRKIELTATFTYGQATESKVYEVTVLEEEKELAITEIYPIQMSAEVDQCFYLPLYAIVKTADEDVLVWEVKWQDGRVRKFSKQGSYTVDGELFGTGQELSAQIEVVQDMPVQHREHNPKCRSLWDEVLAGDMKLTEGSGLYLAQRNMHHFLLQQEADQMLYNFRVAAGLDTKGAEAMIGWDAPDGLLRGHTSGHYLSALALAYHATGNQAFLEKAVYMVTELGKCQKAFEGKAGYQKGFLSAYSQEQFDQLEAFVKYPDIWAPYYTLHKILAGLLDCYRWCGIQEALTIADGIGDWVCDRLGRLSKEHLEKMWSIYIAGEFGGMNESMAQLFHDTGKEQYIEIAKLFDNEKLFFPLEQGIDALSGMHANQHIPQIIGAMKIFEQTGEKRYYQIAHTFWNLVISGHMYANGGVGESEMFHRRNCIGGLLTENTTESCASYNMMKLTKMLYSYEPKASYMDYYERAMLNHIQATLDKQETGESTYFFPLCSEGKREFLCENSCCHGTGMENHSKYMECAYFYNQDTLYVNLFVASEVHWANGAINILQKHEDEHPEKVLIQLRKVPDTGDKKVRTVKIRRPKWNQGNYTISVNGCKIDHAGETDGYLILESMWDENNRMTIEIFFSCNLYFFPTPDDASCAALMYGPYVLAALTAQKERLRIENVNDLEKKITKDREKLQFQYQDVRFVPLYQVDQEVYQAYVRVKDS